MSIKDNLPAGEDLALFFRISSVTILLPIAIVISLIAIVAGWTFLLTVLIIVAGYLAIVALMVLYGFMNMLVFKLKKKRGKTT